jgi:hypothetical protein
MFVSYNALKKISIWHNSHEEVPTVQSKIKKIEMAMINTLQLVARKNVIQMSLKW